VFRDVMGAKEVRVRIMEGVRRGRGGDCGVQLRWDWGADFENVWPFAVCVIASSDGQRKWHKDTHLTNNCITPQ